ncbi:hypothetical protein GOP47_0008679 [Adiantum capillus-veneris]|uniref:Uncharacterized protein n=1 Tax=Adiantum capillus-veneris TaxID=13818 RepID=A0A9D4ZIE7_ADICA|nr:hypothetical protein GOP47_0008679 [Adiantum capillus-veneris]
MHALAGRRSHDGVFPAIPLGTGVPGHLLIRRVSLVFQPLEVGRIMPRARVSNHVHSPSVDVFIDMGHPFLNRTVDGFLKIGAVGAAHAASQEIFASLKKESVTKHDLQHTAKRMGKEGVQWGVIAGVYSGMQYGMERVRGKRDWKNALLGDILLEYSWRLKFQIRLANVLGLFEAPEFTHVQCLER